MKKRERALFPALALVLFCLAGCADPEPAAEPAAACDGVWYAAKTGVECRFGDGKIYRDDNTAQEGQTLAGIYSVADDHIEAHLTGVGGVSVPRKLYLMDGGQGEVLCDRADGSGEVYFYRDPLAVLAILDARQAEPDPASTDGAAPTAPAPEPPEPDGTADPQGAEAPAPEPGESAADASPAADPEPAAPDAQTKTNSDLVWIPQSGSKYHRDPSCSGMKNPKQVPLSEALSKGYTACKRCY